MPSTKTVRLSHRNLACWTVRAALRSRHYSRRTEEAYVAWIRRYIVFHGQRHPAEMGAPEITRFLSWLAVANVGRTTGTHGQDEVGSGHGSTS